MSTPPDGAAALPPWLFFLLLPPPGLPLPRAVCLELRCPGGALLYLHDCARLDGKACRFGVTHVRDAFVSGLTPGKALAFLSRAYRETSSAFAFTDCPDLL